MVRKSIDMGIGSQSRCMQRCTQSSVSRACLLLLRSRFKGLSGVFHRALNPNHAHYIQNQHHIDHEHVQQQGSHVKHERRSQKGSSVLKEVQSQAPLSSLRTPKRANKAAAYTASLKTARGHISSSNGIRESIPSASDVDSSGKATGGESGSGASYYPAKAQDLPGRKSARWDARRRDSKMNGADLYVARFTKNGYGNARPCWRCLEWCRWAGVKRIFHWCEETNTFDVVKVNSAPVGMYETHADARLFAGLVSLISQL